MKILHVTFAALPLALFVACAPSSNEGSAGATAAATEEAKRHAEAPSSWTAGNITLKRENVHVKVKALHPQESDDEWRADFDSCDTDVDFLSIRGTPRDTEINAILRGDWRMPTAETCEFPESYVADVTLHLLDPDQGLLSMSEGENWYEGGSHPYYTTEFKVIDLRSGNLLTLGDYVKSDAAPKLLALTNRKIETQLTRVYLDKPTIDQSGREHLYEMKVLDAESQAFMKQLAHRLFTTEVNGVEQPANPSQIRDFLIGGTGIHIDLANQLSYAAGGMTASYNLLWSDLATADALRTDTDLIDRTKAARPKQQAH